MDQQLANSTSNARNSVSGPQPEIGNSKLQDCNNPAQIIEQLFLRLMDLYGVKFATPKPDGWVRELADFTPDAIAFALNQAEKLHTEWPPALIEFKALCRAYTPPLAKRVAAERQAIERHAGKGRNTLAQTEAMKTIRGLLR